MKIMTILGTRPEIIRLSRIIPQLDQLFDHILVHTGQNYDITLNEVFFSQLRLRKPDHLLNCSGKTAMEQVANILMAGEQIIMREKPDRLLILGDTNSALAAIAAKRLGIKVFHMEAGNRCYDDRVPEEVNRRIIDHCSDYLLPYTERSRTNLLREGIPDCRIFVTGNPILEVLQYYADEIDSSNIIQQLQLIPGKYFLVTLHRAENVDLPLRLANFLDAIDLLNLEYEMPVVFPLHPHTRNRLSKNGQFLSGSEVKFIEPAGLFDFIQLEKNAFCVLSDSGTVQEECCILQIPNVTLRDVTERPETMESGSSILTGNEPGSILEAVNTVLNLPASWGVPSEYKLNQVSTTVIKIVSGQFSC